MSSTEPPSDQFKTILLRSSTPAPSEKVLLYLESLRDSGNFDPGSPMSSLPPLNGHSGKRSNVSASRVEDAYEINSNTQDGEKTELSENRMSDMPEPGPQDPPGPHYESFDSGPSFGNFGPLPDHTGQSGIQTSYTGAKFPLPLSVASPTSGSRININIEPPSSSSASRSQKTQSQESASRPRTHKSSVISEDRGTLTGRSENPKARSKAPSQALAGSEAPMSSKSRSRAGSKSRTTDYPALPPSNFSPSGHTAQLPTSPRRAPSISPSDSASLAPFKAAAMFAERNRAMAAAAEAEAAASRRGASSGPMSPSHQSRPFSPYRHAATQEDLLFAATSAAQVPPQPTGQSQVSQAQSHASQARSRVSQARSQASQAQSHASQSRSHMSHARSQTQSQVSQARSQASQVRSQVSQSQSQAPPARSQVSQAPRSQVARSQVSQVRSQVSQGKGDGSRVSHATSHRSQSRAKSPSQLGGPSQEGDHGGEITPTPSRPTSPAFSLDQREAEIVAQTLASRGSGARTSYAASTLETDIVNSHFHDMDLCILLHQMDDSTTHEIVKKALRKAVRQRVKRLGLKHDHESIQQYRKSFHDHDPEVHLNEDYDPSKEAPPAWAKELMEGMARVQERLDVLSPLSMNSNMLTGSQQSYAGSVRSGDSQQQYGETEYTEGGEQYTEHTEHTPRTQTVNINTQVTGTMAESMYQPGETEIIDDEVYEDEAVDQLYPPEEMHQTSEFMDGRDDSPGQQFLEEELYKLRVKQGGSQSGHTHKTWEVARDEQDEYEEGHGAFTESGLPEIPDSERKGSPSLPPLPQDASISQPQSHSWHPGAVDERGEPILPPWQRIHQRLLGWAVVWPMSELDQALDSTTRGHQVNETALSVWSAQTYKRYVRSRMTDSPDGRVDRLFVPPNVADAISTAVFNGRHHDACSMLKELWAPFGLDGTPRLIIVLAKHRSDANHWVVHRFSLPDGALTTYDSYPERTLPDGRPLGWWFAIRIAWPHAIMANPDHLMQKMVRLHRPMQLNIDNSVAAAGIWRNVLMGSRAERSLDLERLRDLINTEVRNLRQRKLQGKLSISNSKNHQWGEEL